MPTDTKNPKMTVLHFGGQTVEEMVDDILAVEAVSQELTVKVPKHLVPILHAVARRQRTTVAVIVAQALSDYCHRGL